MVAAQALRLRVHVCGWRRSGFGAGLLHDSNGSRCEGDRLRAIRLPLDVQLPAGGRASRPGHPLDIRGWRIDEKDRPHSIRTFGDTQDILSELNFEVHLIHEGLVAKTMLEMYDEEAIILEPAGALSVAGL